MFAKFKQMRELQKNLQEERIAVEKEGVHLVMDGSFELRELKLNPELSVEDHERVLKELWGEARKKIQETLLLKMGGFGL
ncbi:YbaB/EbfC family nucleoid-associated protein [Patescibacteria group bacterium]|nr:YbaB/EbfC family nucleoid-associated protein [Patescibacteria group bacterium]